MSNVPPLSAAQILKLKQLTVVSLAGESQVEQGNSPHDSYPPIDEESPSSCLFIDQRASAAEVMPRNIYKSEEFKL